VVSINYIFKTHRTNAQTPYPFSVLHSEKLTIIANYECPLKNKYRSLKS